MVMCTVRESTHKHRNANVSVSGRAGLRQGGGSGIDTMILLSVTLTIQTPHSAAHTPSSSMPVSQSKQQSRCFV